MLKIKNLKRYNEIIWFFLKYGRLDLVDKFSIQADLPQVWKEKDNLEKDKAKDLVKDLEKLGPFFIKLGQLFSTQAQFLSPEYEEELQKLQDKASPMPYEEVERIIIDELGYKPEKIFQQFDREPLSAASLGQVHYAILKNGRPVAVKVQRANIQQQILDDLELIEKIATYFENNSEWGLKYHVTEKFEHLRMTILNELDYNKEANNLKTLHKNLSHFDRIIIPLPINSYTTSRVLTMEYIDADKVVELSPLLKQEIETKDLADMLFRAYLKQILVDGFFHMDPHPGNIYLTKIDDLEYLVIFDLGMVGHVPFQLQGQLIRFLFAISEGKELEIAKIMISMGKKLKNFDEYILRTKIADLIGSYQGLVLYQIPVGKIVLKLAQIASEADLWLPIQFSTIGKTLLSIDPVIKALDKDFEFTKVLQQNASDLLNDRLYHQLSYQSLYTSLLEITDFLQMLPSRLSQFFDIISKGDYQLKLRLQEGREVAENFQKIANRITIGILLSSLVISAALLMRIDTPFKLFGYPGFAILLFLIAGFGAFFLIGSILWNDSKK